MTVAPVEILTERLRLGRVSVEDASLMLAIWNDPSFIRHVGDRGVRTLEDAAAALYETGIRHWEEHGYGPYRVSLRESGDAIGICGLFKRPTLEEPDIGYALLPPFRGQGYAFEASAAVRDAARDEMNLSRVTAIVSPGHARSIRLLENLGMSLEGAVHMPGDDEEISLYAMDL